MRGPEKTFVLSRDWCCCYVMLLSWIMTAWPAGAQQAAATLRIKIRLQEAAPSARITLAPLLYDKDFAFSFTLDDGLVSDYLVALPFFAGGKVAGSYTDQWGSDQGADGGSYPGLYYTDGCGHPKPFRAAIALNARHIAADTVVSPGFLSWWQVDTLYRAGWDILSHGYQHLTGRGVDAAYEVRQNNREVEDHLHLEMRDFVIPGGKDDYLSDGPYTEAAFRAGMETVQSEHFGNWIVRLDAARFLAGLKLGRKFLHTSVSTGEMVGDSLVFNRISAGLAAHDRCWINAFTHGVGKDNLWQISLVFGEFKAFFQRLAAAHGEGGRDDMWMAPTQEVFEYLETSRLAGCKVDRHGRNFLVTIDLGKVPRNLKYHELTLVVEGGILKKVKGLNCRVEGVHSGRSGRSPALVNLIW